jgi:hypothetical protein
MVATDGAFWAQHVDLQDGAEASSITDVKHQVLASSARQSGDGAGYRPWSSIVTDGSAAQLPGGLSMPVVLTKAVGKPAHRAAGRSSRGTLATE